MSEEKRLDADHLTDVLNELGCERPEATDEVRRHIAALEAELARVRQERYDALSAKTTEGLSAAEWQLRAGKAERERDEARAEIARLKPTGPVAEDEYMLRTVLAWEDDTEAEKAKHAAALSRLAAKAQGYEAAVADNAVLVRRIRDYDAHMDLSEPWRNGDLGIEDASGLNEASAALLEAVKGPHHGAALLDRHRKEVAQARNQALDAAISVCVSVYDEHRRSKSYPMDMGGLAVECKERIVTLKKETT